MFKLALRNVFRNRKRSLTAALSVMIGVVVVCFSDGFVVGMLDNWLVSTIAYQTGHIRITTEEYINRERFMPVNEVIWDADEVIAKLEAIEGVTHVEKRVNFGILLGSGDNTVQAIGTGVDLVDSPINLQDDLEEKGQLEESGIYIGIGLAEKLEVERGDKLLLATQTSEGGLNAIKLPVKGRFDMGISMLNENYFFIGEQDADKLLKFYGGTTSIFVFLEDRDMIDTILPLIQKVIPEGSVAQDFKVQMGELGNMINIALSFIVFFEALILFLASFVIINTMMMVILERLHEIGMMKAMGMTDRQLFSLFTIEGAIIGVGGGVIGGLLGWGLVGIVGHIGVDFSQVMSEIDFIVDNIIRPRIPVNRILLIMAVAIIIPSLTAMIPARIVKKFTPAEALRD